MPPISPKSRSFLRQEKGKSNEKEFAYGVNIPQNFLIKNSKSALRDWVIQFHNDKCVVNADLLNIKTLDEIKYIKKDLGDYLTEKFKDSEFKGIVDLHPTSDTTCNTGHIHYWGSGAKEMEKAISEYVVEKGLSVTKRAEELRITSTKFKLNDKNIKENQEAKENKEPKSKIVLENDELSQQVNEATKESKYLINEVNSNMESIKAHLKDVEDYLKPVPKDKSNERRIIRNIKRDVKTANRELQNVKSNLKTTNGNFRRATKEWRRKQFKRGARRSFTKLFKQFVFKFERDFGEIANKDEIIKKLNLDNEVKFKDVKVGRIKIEEHKREVKKTNENKKDDDKNIDKTKSKKPKM